MVLSDVAADADVEVVVVVDVDADIVATARVGLRCGRKRNGQKRGWGGTSSRFPYGANIAVSASCVASLGTFPTNSFTCTAKRRSKNINENENKNKS